MAALIAAHAATAMLVARFADDSARRARGHDDPETRSALDELERLRGLGRPSESSLVTAASIAYRLRKEWG